MPVVSKKMTEALTKASMVRQMFEEGGRMKARFGAENVYDFSLGNPDVPPPAAFHEVLTRLVKEDRPGSHAYMPNAGWPEVRAKVAAFLTKDQGAGLVNPFGPQHIVMNVGAAGALNIVFHSILDQGDEVLTPRPCFLEYTVYAENHNGKLVLAEPGPDFSLNIDSIAGKITPKTRAVLINSPHNPTGVVYSEEQLKDLAKALTEAGRRFGRPIVLVTDDPYRKLVYDGVKTPSIFPLYPYSVVCNSHSKDMSLPGERIGYVAVNPDMPGQEALIEALALSVRTLGFVNAPSLMQLAVAELQGVTVDVGLYKKRRDMFVAGLQKAGYELTVPQGAFYLFPKSPLADDKAFVALLKEEKILAVPGSGFAGPGYFRLCYAVPDDSITNSLPGFARAMEKARRM